MNDLLCDESVDNLQDTCHLDMLHDKMKISRLMVHTQQVEESRVKRKSKDAKRVRSFDSVSSKGRIDIQDKPRFKKMFYN